MLEYSQSDHKFDDMVPFTLEFFPKNIFKRHKHIIYVLDDNTGEGMYNNNSKTHLKVVL